MSGASSVLQIPQVCHQALGFTSGDDLVGMSFHAADVARVMGRRFAHLPDFVVRTPEIHLAVQGINVGLRLDPVRPAEIIPVVVWIRGGGFAKILAVHRMRNLRRSRTLAVR